MEQLGHQRQKCENARVNVGYLESHCITTLNITETEIPENYDPSMEYNKVHSISI